MGTEQFSNLESGSQTFNYIRSIHLVLGHCSCYVQALVYYFVSTKVSMEQTGDLPSEFCVCGHGETEGATALASS